MFRYLRRALGRGSSPGQHARMDARAVTGADGMSNDADWAIQRIGH